MELLSYLLFIFQNKILKDSDANTITNLILIGLMQYFYYNINFIIKFIKKDIYNYISLYIFKKHYNEIIIDTHNSISDRCGIKITKFIYSKTFQAITYYIKKTNPNGIFSKREPDKHEREFNPVFDLFIPDQTKPFLIEPTKQIYCIIKLHEDIYETNKDKVDLYKKHSIKLFSNDKNTSILDIENFIDICLSMYKNYTYDKSTEEQYYFCYIKSEDDGEILKYNEKIFNTNRTFNTIFFQQKDFYINKLNFFLNNKTWYKNKGIPYHLGILLHGEPGCGKTSIIKATLEYTNRNAITIPLSRVKTCGELENIFFETEINHKNIPTDKRIYIFEDIDCLCDIIKDREYIDDDNDNKYNNKYNKKNKDDMQWEILNKLVDKSDTSNITTNPDDELNLSCILNIFDGIIEMPGRIIIMTTNYPEKLDKALLRYGRIDMNINLSKASRNITLQILSSFYDTTIDDITNLCYKKNIQLLDNHHTPAYIVNLCQNNIYDIDTCLIHLSNK